MTQNALVTAVLPNHMAEVVVLRGTACGSSCASCESCKFQNEIRTVCRNGISAQVGQRVIIESKSSRIYGAIFLVYVMPLITFLLGYVLAWSAGASEGICILASFLGLALGALLMVLTQRMKNGKNAITFEIVALDAENS